MRDDISSSAAICCGLIEAVNNYGRWMSSTSGHPQQFAAASLKQVVQHLQDDKPGVSSAAICCGLIEAFPLTRLSDYPTCHPQQFAAASLKHNPVAVCMVRTACHPQQFAAASLKPDPGRILPGIQKMSSAAICCGLIEAWAGLSSGRPVVQSSAAICCGLIEATWRVTNGQSRAVSSAAICCGLIEAPASTANTTASIASSAAICCGLIEAFIFGSFSAAASAGHPQQFAAASLKLHITPSDHCRTWLSSAAICCGLIEAKRK